MNLFRVLVSFLSHCAQPGWCAVCARNQPYDWNENSFLLLLVLVFALSPSLLLLFFFHWNSEQIVQKHRNIMIIIIIDKFTVRHYRIIENEVIAFVFFLFFSSMRNYTYCNLAFSLRFALYIHFIHSGPYWFWLRLFSLMQFCACRMWTYI